MVESVQVQRAAGEPEVQWAKTNRITLNVQDFMGPSMPPAGGYL